MTTLDIREVRKSFGGLQALAGCTFALDRPGIYGLIGPNGAGKTTLFDVITGRQRPDHGHVLIAGSERVLRPHVLAALGMARTFQECRVFPEMTCLENMLFATQPKGLARTLGQAFGRSVAHRRAHEAEARHWLQLATLERYADESASILSFGQRRLLEIAAALVTRPRLLLLDEPAAGVNPALLAVLRDVLVAQQRAQPAVVLIIEHNMEFIMDISERIIVMHQGAVLEQGSPAAIQASPRVIEAYLG
ncbi:MAG TPA: ABC transporter ATP-binding protein [Alphaproteobacteria bacterium]|nr:ABC transporter ATP-binding protein [Alphaproteobacteria bacterium]